MLKRFYTLFFGILLAASLNPVPAGAFGKSNIERTLKHLSKKKRAIPFRFAVIGDTQFANDSLHRVILKDLQELDVDFAIQVGDLIKGYVHDTVSLKKQWSRFKASLKSIGEVPFLPVPGNHDVVYPFPEQEALWNREWGPLFYDFKYRGCHLIILATDEGNTPGMSKKQLTWIRKLLSRKKGKGELRMVFMHRPVFRTSAGVGDSLHAWFKKGGVGHVFYGHEHHYEHEVRDGVIYIQTVASANSHGIPQAGGFPHLLQVSVRSGKSQVSVIKAGAVLSKEIVPRDLAAAVGEIISGKNITMDPIEFDEIAAQTYSIKAEIRNSLRKPVSIMWEWVEQGAKCSVTPKKGTTVLPAKSKIDLRFSLKMTRVKNAGPPSLSLDLQYRIPLPSKDTLQQSFSSPLHFAIHSKHHSLKAMADRPIWLLGEPREGSFASFLGLMGLRENQDFFIVNKAEEWTKIVEAGKNGIAVVYGKNLHKHARLISWFKNNQEKFKVWLEKGNGFIGCLPARRTQAPAEALGCAAIPYPKDEGSQTHRFIFLDSLNGSLKNLGISEISTRNYRSYLNLGYFPKDRIEKFLPVALDFENHEVAVTGVFKKGAVFFTSADLAHPEVFKNSYEANKFWHALFVGFFKNEGSKSLL